MLSRKRPFLLACVITTIVRAPYADGHGTPIHVEVAANRLVVSGGVVDADGFAPMIFLEDDEDGDGTALGVPTLGPAILWQLPGFNILGMDDQSSLSIEFLLRPAKDAAPNDTRLVWHWSSELEPVNQSQAQFHLLGKGMRSNTLAPAPAVGPDPFLLADPIAGEQGFHNHSLLAYALDNDPQAPAGAYGFFARLNADLYGPSDPFLLVFNHGVDYEQMTAAGRTINAAAFLRGDYNHDDRVDAADFVIWRKTIGSTTELAADGSGDLVVDQEDFNVWRTGFGAMFDDPSANGAGSLEAVPEPSGLAIVIVAMTTALARRWRDTVLAGANVPGMEISLPISRRSVRID